jgi:hypothetical protein
MLMHATDGEWPTSRSEWIVTNDIGQASICGIKRGMFLAYMKQELNQSTVRI